MGFARRVEWLADSYQQIGVVALALLCLAVSEIVGASMFIASFVAGLAVQVGFKDAGKRSVEFAEKWGQLFNLSYSFSLACWWCGIGPVQHGIVVVCRLSLTVIRMLPVAIALIGAGLSSASVAFVGWFGPRGLASIVLGLVYLEQEVNLPGEPAMRSAVMVTVLLSIFAHGLSAIPAIDLYAKGNSMIAAAEPERSPGNV